MESIPENVLTRADTSSKRAPLSTNHAYYRSKTFVPSVDINPLIASAFPLFNAASHCQHAAIAPDFDTLQDELTHEIRAFENNAQSHGYRSQTILAARYALCALLDEIIMTRWPEHEWQNRALLKAFHDETWGGERFFVLLDRCLEDPNVYTDLLEFLYLALSLGYEGKYRLATRGHIELGYVIDSVYYAIRKTRGDVEEKRLPDNPSAQHPPLTSAGKAIRKSMLILGATLGLAALIYAGFNMFINHTVAPLNKNFKQLEHALIEDGV